MGCLGGVPIGTALTGGEPITGEEERGGGTLSERSHPSSVLPCRGRLGSPTSLMMDMSGLSWGGTDQPFEALQAHLKEKGVGFPHLHVCGQGGRDADRSEPQAAVPDAVRVHLRSQEDTLQLIKTRRAERERRKTRLTCGVGAGPRSNSCCW